MTSVIDTHSALKHFIKNDPKMAALLKTALSAEMPLKIPPAKPVNRYFATMVSSIVSQQISTKAAASIHKRVVQLLVNITPENVMSASELKLRSCGLSAQKIGYLKYNAEAWHTLPTKNFKEMSDEEIIAELTKLHGVGRWTAEMFLMFTLSRPDVFSYGDLGLMQSLLHNYSLWPHWNRKIEKTVSSWSPHKTTASLTLWYHKDKGPLM